MKRSAPSRLSSVGQLRRAAKVGDAASAAMQAVLKPAKSLGFPYRKPSVPKGMERITVKAGTPAFHVWSVNPFSPLFLTCADEVENKGHQFGVDLSPEDKNALIEFLKTI